MAEMSSARVALADELQCARKEAAADMAAAQAVEAQLQAKLRKLQEVPLPLLHFFQDMSGSSNFWSTAQGCAAPSRTRQCR